MPYRKTVFLLILGIVLSLPVALQGEPSSIVFDFNGKPDKNNVPAGWKLKVKKGKADFRIFTEGDEKVLCFKSVKSSFSFQRKINVDIRRYPYMIMKWKAIRLPAGGDVRKGKTNDQALQTLIAFKGKKVLSYVWDTTAPVGTVTDESVPWPISLKIKVLTVKSGDAELGQWVTVTRNIYEDFKELFGSEPPPAEGLRVQINSQHTGTTAESCFGKVVFKKML
jgi:hypothetical protein